MAGVKVWADRFAYGFSVRARESIVDPSFLAVLRAVCLPYFQVLKHR